MKNKQRSIGVLISYAGTVAGMLCGLVLSSFLLRTLGDSEYGLYQTISSFVMYLVLLQFGTGTVMARNISVCLNQSDEKDVKGRIDRNYSTIWIISLILSAVMLAAGLVFYFSLGNIYSKTMTEDQIAYAKSILLILLSYLIVNYLTQNISGFLLACEEYVFSNLLNLIKVLSRTVILIVVISFFRYAIFIAVVDLTLTLIVFILSIAYVQGKYKPKLSFRLFDKSVFVSSVPMCVALLLQALTNQANNNVDKFVIGVMMNMESVALYSVVQFIFTSFSSLATVPVSLFLPEISKNMTRGLSPRKFTNTLISPCRLTVVICGSILCGFFAVGSQFISVVYGESKTDAWLYTLIILIPMFVNMSNAVIINVMDIANKRLVRSLILLGTTILNIIMTVFLINIWGIIGAVIATAVSLIIGNIIIMNVYYKKVMHINVMHLFKSAYAGLLPFQIIAGIVAFLAAKFISNQLIGLLAGGALYLLLSFGLIYIFGLKKEEKAWVTNKIKRGKKNK